MRYSEDDRRIMTNRIGELVLDLANDGQLVIGDSLNSPDQCGFFVKWQMGPKVAIRRDDDLLYALENVQRQVRG